MTEERISLDSKQVKTVFVGDDHLATHYVNIINVRSGLEEFFLTLGTVLPLEITDSTDLENIDSINAHALFRCAIPRSVMKQVIDLMTTLYENQSRQIEQLQTRKDDEIGDSDSRLS